MNVPLRTAIGAFRQSGDAAGVLALIPYTAFVGLDTFLDADGLVSALHVRPSNIGNTQIPAVHGGVVGALLEHAAILQLFYQMETDHIPKTINISIDYLRPCRAGERTFARAHIIKQGRRIANVRITAWQTDPARPVAAAHAHFLVS